MGNDRQSIETNAIYHLTTRGNNQRILFSYPRDYRFFLRALGRALNRVRSVSIYQLTLMKNHIHLLARTTKPGGISGIMKRSCQEYARWRNEQRGSSGKLFERRFYSERLDTLRSVAFATLYNDSNGVRGGVVATAEEHRWSSVGHHAGRPELSAIPRGLLSPNPWIMELGTSSSAREAAYRTLLQMYVAGKRDAHPSKFVRVAEERSKKRPSHRVTRPSGKSAR